MSITEELEAMIDKHGLMHVLTGLELVCEEKAAHIKLNWGDKALARRWGVCSNLLYSVVKYAEGNNL